MKFVGLLLLLFVVAYVSAQHKSPRVHMEGGVTPREHFSGWVMGEHVDSSLPLTLTFALKLRNTDELAKTLMEVSDPDSPSYGQHLSLAEVSKRFGAAKESVDTVTALLHEHGVTDISLVGDFLLAHLDAKTAETLLDCRFHYFSRKENPSKKMVRAAASYSLPKEVQHHVDFVGGVKHFPELLVKPTIAKKDPKAQPLDWDLAVTPRWLRDQYKIGDVVGTQANNSQSVVQWLEEYFNMADLDEFFGLLLPSALGDRPSETGPNGWGAGMESSLDIEYIMSTGEHIPTLFWSNPDPKKNGDPFLAWAVSLNAMANPPKVISVSYGEDERSVSADYIIRVDQEFQKAGLRGVSILFASGDSGVGGSDSGCKQFVPDFPASCPSITSVGGTQMSGFIENGVEIVNGLSGGGFSNVFSQPSYQTAAVQNYVKTAKNLPAQKFWNATGRAYPDVSALSSNFLVVVNLIPVPGVAGTSCAAPTTGGMVALLNDLRIAKGKSTLGFLNPLIYKLGAAANSALTDITQGSNPGCGQNGFTAAKGFDPASGYGSINYAAFAAVVQNLP